MLAIEDLIARAEITDVLYRYAHAIDRRDFEMLRGCYHVDGFDNHGGYVGDADGLVAWIEERHRTVEFSMHFLGNVLIELGEDLNTAHVESYCMALQRLPRTDPGEPAAVTNSTGIRFIDEFEKRGDVWRIASRVVAFEWKRSQTRDETSTLSTTFALGRRDRDDPYYGTAPQA
jgi:hypothetical protein